ncbi:MAG: formate--tetrahydrofolate ligase [Alphaproteobacteria bacterium]
MKRSVPSDIEIARAATPLAIDEIAAKLDIPAQALEPFGRTKAKLDTAMLPSKARAKLVLVTAMSPTPAGEGKTTTTAGLGDALNLIGKRTAICLREPSLGPCFGMKGGAAGGGYAQVIPMEDINLHFTGDFHAITSAHSLLSAMVDNHVYWGNSLGLDVRRITWRRVVDMNDRSLRSIVSSLGGVANGFPREAGFDITVASEIMAILCLADGLADLEARIKRIVVGETAKREPVTAADIGAAGAMTVLLKEALKPNLVQTLEGNPAFVHGGPFANIAHGCNSVSATKTAMSLADIVVTEAGFGADLGAEKFFNIKCRSAGLKPDAVVIVATIRALRHHGGVAKADLAKVDLSAVKAGLENLGRHIRNIGQFGVPATVAINRFDGDDAAEIEAVKAYCAELGIEAHMCSHWAEGGAGAQSLATHVAELVDSGTAQFRPLYDDDMPLWEKARTIARSIYGADDIVADKKIREQFTRAQDNGHGKFPICMAKTQYSCSTDPTLRGAPSNHVVPIRELRISAGAGFAVAVCGDIMTMPGLPRKPSAEAIGIGKDGQIEGLF